MAPRIQRIEKVEAPSGVRASGNHSERLDAGLAADRAERAQCELQLRQRREERTAFNNRMVRRLFLLIGVLIVDFAVSMVMDGILDLGLGLKVLFVLSWYVLTGGFLISLLVYGIRMLSYAISIGALARTAEAAGIDPS